MSTSPNPIAIVITDGVDAGIVTKIQAIGVAAKESAGSVTALQASVASLSGTGISELKSQIDSASGSLTQLKSATSGAATEQQNLSTATNDLTQAQNGNASTSARLAGIMLQQLDASKALAAAKKDLASAEKTLGQAAAGGSAAAQGVIQGYRDQYTTAATLVANLRQARAEAGRFKQSQEEVVPALNNTVSANQAASAAIRGLEGNFGTSVRAGENFLTKILQIGPALQVAFPVFGAIALIGIIGILADHVNKIITSIRNASNEAQAEGIRQLNQGKEVIPGKRGFGAFFTQGIIQGRAPEQDIELNKASLVTEQVNAQLRLNELRNDELSIGKKGLELQQARSQEIRNNIDLTVDAIQRIQAERNKIQNNTGFGLGGLLDKKVITNPIFQGIPGSEQISPQIPKDTEQFKKLTAEAEAFDGSIRGLKEHLQTLQVELNKSEKTEPFAALKDNTKAAREQLRYFETQLSTVRTALNKDGTGASSDAGLQKQLNLLNFDMSVAFPQNAEALQAKLATVTGEINRHAQVVGTLFEKYQDAATNIGLYSDALKESNEFDKEMLKLKRDGITLTDAQIAQLKEVIKYTTENQQYQSDLKKIFTEFQGPLHNYIAAFEAIDTLERDGTITHAQAVQAQNQAVKSYQDAISPLNEYAHGLQNQIALFGNYGTALTVATQVQQVQEQLRQKGLSLTANETQQLTKLLTLMERQKELQQSINALYGQNQGQRDKLLIQEQALDQARRKGIISEEQFNVQLAATKVALSNVNIEMNKFTKSDLLTSVFGGYLKDFKGFTVGVTQLWQQTFSTIADGAANALGRAIAYGEDLGAALKDVARQALSEIISGMIKLGIQVLINTFIAKTGLHTIASTSLAAAAELATAWWDVASAVSLATFGANAAPAAAGMITTAALGELLAAAGQVSGKAAGGEVRGPGTSTSDSILTRLSNKEFVLRASAVQSVGTSTLEYMNRTGQVPSGGPRITVLHDGTTGIQVVPYGENDIRIIARQEANKVVETKAPNVVAGHLDNPNSLMSKAVKRNTTATRRR